MKSTIPKQRRIKVAAILFLAAAFLAPLASAQSTTGTLRGTVKDETGGVLPGATVEAINDETGYRQAATTLTSGFFNIAVSPGPYTVTATLPSFGTETKKVRILLGQTQMVDFQLAVAARVTEQVTVSASPAVELRSSEVATNVTDQQIENLPQNSRNFVNFAALAPGVRLNDDENATKTFSSASTDKPRRRGFSLRAAPAKGSPPTVVTVPSEATLRTHEASVTYNAPSRPHARPIAYLNFASEPLPSACPRSPPARTVTVPSGDLLRSSALSLSEAPPCTE